ncbi:PAS domain S-box protein [Candidatus Electronema sp. PJ]|uniref:PAS domain S-box protein n=1 Tax=Candidatus Electronema sp. PJ TaxID=3401572 RepID=UPI003AA8B197
MKKNRTLFIGYVVMAAGLVGLVLLGGLFVVYNHRQHLAQDVKIYRYSLAQESEALRQTYYQLVSISNLLAKNPVVINSLDRHLNGEEATDIAVSMVERNLEAIAAIENVSSVFLVSLDGSCLYSSRKERVGKNYREIDYVRNTLKTGSGLYAMMTVASGRTGLYYAQAIKNGNLRIGVAVLEIRPNFFHLHSFTAPFTDGAPEPSDVRIGLSTDSNILLNTTESTLVSLQPIPTGFLPENLPPQSAIQSLNFPGYNKEALITNGFLQLKNTAGTEYYLFLQPIVNRSLFLIHVINRTWFHRNYHPASSDYSGYLLMLAGMLCVMLGLLWMVNRRHRQVLLAAETLKREAEQRIVEKEKYETIINRNPQGFWLNDFSSGVILEVNQSLCRLLGLDAGEIIGHCPEEFLIPQEEDDRAEEQRLSDISYEGRLRLRGGQAADVLINSSCIVVPGSGKQICFSFFADISERKKEQEQLFLFSQAVEQSTSAIVITDKQARIVYVNSAFVELTGWSQEEVCGTDPGILTGEETYTAAGREIWRQISNGGTWKGVLRGWKKDGSTYWEGQTVCPLYDDKGRIAYYLAIKNDITQRLELERKFKAQLAKLELMVEHAAIGIAHVVEHRFAWASRAAAEMFGYTSWEEVAELPASLIFENEEAHQNTVRQAEEAFGQDQVFHADQLMRRKDGSLFWCSLTGKIIDPGMPDQGAVWLTKDISRQKEEERQLQLAKERAEQANQAKNDFLANISHEIRTPMNAIIGMSLLALESGLNERQQGYISRVKNAADWLMGLLNDILDFSRIESGKLQLEPAPFDLERTVSEAVQTVRYPAEEKRLSLSWDIAPEVPRFVEGDALRLRQILVNLLKNSIKFSEKGGISVRVAVEERREGQFLLVFQVHDQGIGIPPDKLNDIFERFVQADTSLRRDFSGIGLGLTICSQLCELMGGRISAQSELHQGSTFTFTVWFKEISQEEEIKLNGLVSTPEKLRILVVDDNESNRFLAKAMLQRDNHEIAEACNGKEALRLLLKQDFDAVLMDVQMPVMDGLTVTKIIRACEQEKESCCLNTPEMPDEFCAALRSQLKGGHLPIVALTANNFKVDEQRCLQTGMDAYAVKPFSTEDIYRAFRRCCLRKQQRQLSAESCSCMTEQSQAEETAMADTEEKKLGGLLAEVAEHLKNIYSLDPEQVEQMMQISASSISETLAQAKEALAAGDLDTLSATGHKAKGVLLGIGLKEEADLARQIELKGKSGEEADYSGLLDRLEAGLQPLLVLRLSQAGS